MPITDEEDRLIDVLLAEELGGEQPPDVTARVLARARSPERRIVRIGARVLAAAVVVLAALAGYMVTVGGGRPGTEAGPGGVARGATLVAGAEAEELRLGGYCRVLLAPGGALREEGTDGAEAIFLERGKVACKVDRAVGTFRVRTDLGRVDVTGTEFSVELVQEEGEEMRMLVKVLVGSVLVVSASGQRYALAEGDDERIVPDRPVARQKYTPLPEGIQYFKGYIVGDIVLVDDRGVVLKVKSIKAQEGSRAKNPSSMVGRNVRVLFIAFKGADGKYHPGKWLVRAVRKAHTPEGGTITAGVFADRDEALIMSKVWTGAQHDPERPDDDGDADDEDDEDDEDDHDDDEHDD